MTTSRRTLVRGAAWTVPVVAAMAAAPAFATSPRFDCSGSRWCKTANGSKWDFKFWPVCKDGIVATVLINGKSATYVPAQGNRAAYWVLRNQPHSYTFSVQVRDGNGTLGFNRVVDVRNSSCG